MAVLRSPGELAQEQLVEPQQALDRWSLRRPPVLFQKQIDLAQNFPGFRSPVLRSLVCIKPISQKSLIHPLRNSFLKSNQCAELLSLSYSDELCSALTLRMPRLHWRELEIGARDRKAEGLRKSVRSNPGKKTSRFEDALQRGLSEATEQRGPPCGLGLLRGVSRLCGLKKSVSVRGPLIPEGPEISLTFTSRIPLFPKINTRSPGEPRQLFWRVEGKLVKNSFEEPLGYEVDGGGLKVGQAGSESTAAWEETE
ncbi:hypothetical protein MJG53_017517 [Ovis ammon polii x Ovis aries]|uniref:Uncharacterized protein n=1 Tax=Ovis ammon polii x Ovis aries TaxID=2918886 RepID=A0ACB9U7T1_9CETA|nr:hypothetical protein MJG53_017517 [Ovis ammon polii x Ovis aries]